MTTINNKHVLITGGASGLGRLLALRGAEFGAAVTIWDRDAVGAEAVAAETKASAAGARAASTGTVRAFACDVGDRAQVLMPFMVRTPPAMRLLPVWAFDRPADFFGVTAAMDEFTSRGEPGA